MRRCFSLVVPLVLLTLALSDAPALALCAVFPLVKVVKTSDAVWWGSVTDASVAPEGSPGFLKLTVQLDDVLKGPGSPGGTGIVYTNVCAGLILPGRAAGVATSFVGAQRLFIGHIDENDSLLAYIVRRQGRSSEQQYDTALSILGLTRGPTDEPVAATSIQWLVIGVAILVVAAGLMTVLAVRRRGKVRS
jgi:hypothetical protein